MKIYDISRTLQEAPVYPGDEAAQITAQPERGGFRCSQIVAGSHCGTHADAFSHYLEDGLTIDAMPLEAYCGPCRVLTVGGSGGFITVDELRGRIAGRERVVLHGGGSAYLCEEAAEYLSACGVRLVVTDALSIAPTDNEAPVHAILMQGGVGIVENAVLDGVPDGDYLIFAFPVKYGGCDGAPVRAVLVCEDEKAGDGRETEVFSGAAGGMLDIPGTAD